MSLSKQWLLATHEVPELDPVSPHLLLFTSMMDAFLSLVVLVLFLEIIRRVLGLALSLSLIEGN